jgi:hypothetical protein
MRLVRSFVVLVVAFCLLGGCTAYLKQLNPTRKAPRREAADIAVGGVAQLLVGGLIVAGSYCWFNSAKANPEPVSEDELAPAVGAMLGMLLGGSMVLSGVSDDTIALYQALSNDHLIPPYRPLGGTAAPCSPYRPLDAAKPCAEPTLPRVPSAPTSRAAP